MKAGLFQQIARVLLRKHNVRNVRSVQLAQALSKGRIRVLKKGHFLCKEGEEADRMYVIAQGSIQVSRKNRQGISTELLKVKGPSMIGQMGLIDGSKRSATCVTLERTTLILFNKDEFTKLMNERCRTGAAFRHLIMFTMMNQLTDTNEKIKYTLHKTST
jgi:CRP/FNR family transcriptional regulator, cyclic AMP receptor protein